VTIKKTQLIAPRAPRLPSADGPSAPAAQTEQTNNALKSYFAQIDTTQSALLGPTGARFLDFPYGIFYQNADQVSGNTSSTFAVKFPSQQEGTGVTVVEDTKLTVDYPGLYVFSFLLQLKNVDSANRDVYFWLRKNGVDVENTAHRITAIVGYSRPSLNFTIQLDQDDYVQLMWNTTDTDVSLAYTAAQTVPVMIPAIPSSYVSVQFNSAVNSNEVVPNFIPPPAPSPTPVPPPPPPPGPTPAPPPPSPNPGQDSDVQAIVNVSGTNTGWWYPASANDRYQNSDGTGAHPYTTTSVNNAPYGRLDDHTGHGFNLLWPGTDRPNNYPDGSLTALGLWSHPNTVALGGSTTGLTAAFAVRFDAGSFNTLFSDVGSSAATSLVGTYLRFANGTLTFSVGNGASRVAVSQTGLIAGASAPKYVVIVWFDDAANTINLKVNDLATQSAAFTGSIAAGQSGLQLFSNPFADFSLGGWEGWDQLYGICHGAWFGKNVTLGATDRDTLRYWLARQAGVTLSGGTAAPAPTPAPPAPAPPPAPSAGVPTISNMARHPRDLLKIGNYYIEWNPWGASRAGISEGSNAWEYQMSVERSLTVGANGEVAFRASWYWPQFRQNGTSYDHNNAEVKCYPSVLYGAKPGFDSQGTQWPAFDYEVRLPDGVSVPSAPPGTPGPIAANWQPLGGSVSTAAPAGSSGGVLPLQNPQVLSAQVRLNRNTNPTGVGHVSFDIWLQETSTQAFGFVRSSITHEIMIPLINWGNYGSPHTTGGTWSRSIGNYSHDAVIGGVTYKVYANGANQGAGAVGYTFSAGGLDGSFTNEETGAPRTGWKFICYVPVNLATTGHPADSTGLMTIDIAGILADIRAHRDGRGINYSRGTEYVVSVELGEEVVYGAGDITVYDYNVRATALPPPPPPPPPAPAPAPSGAPFYPFGSRLNNNALTGDYNYGTPIAGFTKAQFDARAISCYNKWKAARVRRAPTFVANSDAAMGLAGATITTGYYVDFGDGTDSVRSEGQGYGMMIIAAFAGYDPEAQTILDGMLQVARARFAYSEGTTLRRYLMDYRLGLSMQSLGDGYSATDGDEDIAYALLMADKQWGSAGTYNYKSEAINTINALKEAWMSGLGTLRSSYWNVSRTSDYMPSHFAAFKTATGDTAWDTITARSATLVNTIVAGYSASAKLQPGFIYDPDGTPRPDNVRFIDHTGLEGYYDYNACRNPWRFGVHYLLSGDTTWQTFAVNLTTTIKSVSGGDPFNTPGYMLLNGTAQGGRWLNAASSGPAMVGAMCSSAHTDYAKALFIALTDNYPTSYFDAEIALLCILIATGNWWKP
jgi:hypothetical protein